MRLARRGMVILHSYPLVSAPLPAVLRTPPCPVLVDAFGPLELVGALITSGQYFICRSRLHSFWHGHTSLGVTLVGSAGAAVYSFVWAATHAWPPLMCGLGRRLPAAAPSAVAPLDRPPPRLVAALGARILGSKLYSVNLSACRPRLARSAVARGRADDATAVAPAARSGAILQLHHNFATLFALDAVSVVGRRHFAYCSLLIPALSRWKLLGCLHDAAEESSASPDRSLKSQRSHRPQSFKTAEWHRRVVAQQGFARLHCSSMLSRNSWILSGRCSQKSSTGLACFSRILR